jgi:predicted DCC family thiol-disulfide oxidoreductase YuxK
LKRDTEKIFQFASLQSTYGTGLSNHFHLSTTLPTTIVLYDGQKILTESDAVINITRHLNGLWKFTALLLIIPRFIRNPFYRLIARNRYKLFGKRDQCMVPSEDVKGRFVDRDFFTRGQA